MCKNFIKSLKDVTEVLGKERMAKALEGMTANELLDLIMQDKPLFSKDNELSEKRRAAANARWNAKQNANSVCKTDMQNSDASVDTQHAMQNAYAKDDANLDANNECKMECKVDAKEEHVPHTTSYSELQSQFSKFEAAAEDVMKTNDPFTIKAFRTKLDAWYKGAGAGAIEFIGDVNFLTQQLVAKLAELTGKENNNG